MSASSDLKSQVMKSLLQAKSHLEYSFKKVQKIPLSSENLTEEQLETLESFSSRFARLSDMIISKYFRLLLKEKDPAYRGSVLDILNQAEKYGWIEDAKIWKRIRELRNVAAHEYEASNYKQLYTELIQLTPHLLKVSVDL